MRKKRKKKRRSSQATFATWLGIVLILTATVPFVYLYYRGIQSEPAGEPSPVQKHTVRTLKEIPEYSPSRNRVAIVIDDIGYELWPVNEILKMDAPVTVSILPDCTYSTEAAEKTYRAHREILLHLPMEPADFPDKNPGNGALLLSMSDNEIRHEIEKHLRSVPHACGVNNHMGSRFMEDEKKLEVVLRTLKGKNLFFVDSYTTRETKGRIISKKIGLKFAGRDMFIDNGCDYTETLENLRNIIDKREHWRTLVIIGHPYESTIQAIKKALPILKSHRIEIVPLSDLIA